MFEVCGIVPLVNHHLGYVQDYAVGRRYGEVQVSSDHSEVVGRTLTIAAVHQTVGGRQNRVVVDQASAADVATAERLFVAGFHPDRDLVGEMTDGSVFACSNVFASRDDLHIKIEFH